jgi:Ni,Fe-hydrogenase I cytochrome b subunit
MKQLLFLAIDKIKPSEIGLNPTATDPNATINTVLTTVYAWAGILCVLAMVIAGLFYVTSTANPSHTKRAREAILYAAIGLIVVLMAFVITQFILGRF